jgi:CheY-like chemotaxis protein
LPPEDIRHVRDGHSALTLLTDCKHMPRLLLVSLQLATPPGMQILKQLRSTLRARRIPIVAVSTSVDADTIARGYDLCVNSVISKGDRAEQFEHSLAHLAPYWLQLNQPCPVPGVTR